MRGLEYRMRFDEDERGWGPWYPFVDRFSGSGKSLQLRAHEALETGKGRSVRFPLAGANPLLEPHVGDVEVRYASRASSPEELSRA